MRKHFTIILALATILLCSCNKNAPENNFLPAPAMAEYAQKITLDTPIDDVAWIEFTEGGKYILAKERTVGTKANDSEYEYFTGSFIVQNGVYILDNYGTISLGENKITIEPYDGEPVEVTVTVTPQMAATDFITTIARTWKVDNIRLNLEYHGSSINITKPGCNFQELMGELKKNGMNVNPESWAGFVVADVVLTKSQTFMIEFTERDAVIGTFSANDSGSFNYSITITNGNEEFSGTASGQITLDNGSMVIQMDITVKSGDKTKSGNIVMFLSEP